MIRADARLRVVLVNYNGGDLLQRAVRSALTSQWPGEVDVVVVDNASTDDSLAAIEELAGVHIIHNETNEGFSANNHGLADLIGDEFALQLPEPDVVALLNPDAVVRPEAFRRLAGVLDAGKLIGVASPTILFDRPFIECHILAGDEPLVISHIQCGDDDLASQCHGVNGAERFPGPDGPVWHCPHRSILRVPVAALGAQLELGIERGEGVIDGESVEPGMVYTSPVAARPSLRIVQNAGVRIDSAGVGHSRGFTKRVEEPLGADTALWTGAAAVFHADYFRTVGGFDPEYFLYYEDVELGLRGLATGGRPPTCPTRSWSTVTRIEPCRAANWSRCSSTRIVCSPRCATGRRPTWPRRSDAPPLPRCRSLPPRFDHQLSATSGSVWRSGERRRCVTP